MKLFLLLFFLYVFSSANAYSQTNTDVNSVTGCNIATFFAYYGFSVTSTSSNNNYYKRNNMFNTSSRIELTSSKEPSVEKRTWWWGGQPQEQNKYTIDYTGYFYATETGFYTATFSTVDKASLYIGTDAFDCCQLSTPSQGNVFMYSTGTQGHNSDGSRKIYLQAGTYYPIRIVYEDKVDQIVTLP